MKDLTSTSTADRDTAIAEYTMRYLLAEPDGLDAFVDLGEISTSDIKIVCTDPTLPDVSEPPLTSEPELVQAHPEGGEAQLITRKASDIAAETEARQAAIDKLKD